jgi:hypothetical protein
VNRLFEEVQMETTRSRRRWLPKAAVAGVVLAGSVAAAQVAHAASAAPQTGFIKICKAASGAGVTGDFQFTVSGVKDPVTVPVGGCSKSVVAPSGQVTIAETAQVGVAVAAITTDPVGRLVSRNLAARKASVKVPAGSVASQTIVTFANKTVPTGFVQVCKKAAADDKLAGDFAFTVLAGGVTTKLTVAVGTCSTPVKVTAGLATVTEAAHPDSVLSAIDVAPADRAVSRDLARRTATVKVGAATTPTTPVVATAVTFTNKTVVSPSPSPSPTGTVRVCKIAGPGVTAGQEFAFTVGTTKTTAKAGSCSAPITLALGNVTVTETVPAGYAVAAITASGTGSLVSGNIATGTAVVKVAAGATDVNFTNKKLVYGCTRSKGYYKNHPDAVAKLVTANGGTLAIGGVALTPAQIATIFGRDASNFLNQVSQQLITARLNQLGGASTPADVQTAIGAAQALEQQAGGPLTGTATPQTTVVLAGVTYTASQLVDKLGSYNEGTATGVPPACV